MVAPESRISIVCIRKVLSLYRSSVKAKELTAFDWNISSNSFGSIEISWISGVVAAAAVGAEVAGDVKTFENVGNVGTVGNVGGVGVVALEILADARASWMLAAERTALACPRDTPAACAVA